MVDQLHFAKGPFRYAGDELDRGQVVPRLKGTPNDQRLVGLGYLIPFERGEYKLHRCDMCGADFVQESFYVAHKAKSRQFGCKADGGNFTNREIGEIADVDHKKIEDPKPVRVSGE